MTYCHVYQNLLVIGTSDGQMALAARAVAELSGGIAVVRSADVVKRLPLPVGGVLGALGVREMAAEVGEVEDALRSLGCTFDSPVLSIAFCALPTIPAYGLTDRGLYDVTREEFVDVVLEANG
jgi:adenine deaminase